MRKLSFSLIEVLIALFLLSVLMSTLLFWYRSFCTQKHTFERLKNSFTEEHFAKQQLSRLLSSIELPLMTTKQSQALIFFNDCGINSEPSHSGTVMNMLYVDATTQTLCVATWPKPNLEMLKEESPFKTRILLDNVAHCQLSFYYAPEPQHNPVDPESVGRLQPKTGWQTEWFSSYQKLPQLIRLKITRQTTKENQELTYTFDLPTIVTIPKL